MMIVGERNAAAGGPSHRFLVKAFGRALRRGAAYRMPEGGSDRAHVIGYSGIGHRNRPAEHGMILLGVFNYLVPPPPIGRPTLA